MSVAALTTVPPGTIVRISIRLPNQSPQQGDSFVWTAPRPMTVEEARQEITLSLVKTFMETFLPID